MRLECGMHGGDIRPEREGLMQKHCGFYLGEVGAQSGGGG